MSLLLVVIAVAVGTVVGEGKHKSLVTLVFRQESENQTGSWSTEAAEFDHDTVRADFLINVTELGRHAPALSLDCEATEDVKLTWVHNNKEVACSPPRSHGDDELSCCVLHPEDLTTPKVVSVHLEVEEHHHHEHEDEGLVVVCHAERDSPQVCQHSQQIHERQRRRTQESLIMLALLGILVGLVLGIGGSFAALKEYRSRSRNRFFSHTGYEEI